VSCADLEKAVDAEWRAQQADIERAQEEFHAVDETAARREREALQARLDDAAVSFTLPLRTAPAILRTSGPIANPLGTKERPDGDHRFPGPLL
jgi:hypothetical protein